MGKIKREDMLELTRRMNLNRNCFSRITGAYMDEEGYVDGTFHTHFLKLSASDRSKNLAIAKAIPFAETNVNLIKYEYLQDKRKPGTIGQLLTALIDCELKNDALLDVFYELMGERYKAKGPYAIYFFYGVYDVPVKGSDSSTWESEEVYQFMVCAVCPLVGDYEPGLPEAGFLYPAFTNRSSDMDAINVFQADEKHPHLELVKDILGI